MNVLIDYFYRSFVLMNYLDEKVLMMYLSYRLYNVCFGYYYQSINFLRCDCYFYYGYFEQFFEYLYVFVF